ncbi:MAG TPA: hypothetical protein VGN72_05625 [Tepidisphaeraceae bacterium]|jgi:hypothetical protein|nr:hypothetical protein [Tepidisphaeraceae bacterium]
MSDFLPIREPMLVTWSTDFLANVGVIGVDHVGLVSAQQAALQVAVDAFVSAYGLANDPATRTRPSVELKRTTKGQMIAMIRQLAGIIQKHPATTDAQRAQLGLTVRRVARPGATPGTPSNFKVSLGADGSLELSWKCRNPGASGTMYRVDRKIGSSGEFEYIGGVGGKRFVDPTVPAGTSQLTYRVQGVRSTAVGASAQFNVNFGMTGSHPAATTAAADSIRDGQSGPTPKMAA